MKYAMPYSIVISKADLIVDGTVIKVSKNEYQFSINQFVKGKSSSKINISIWKEWLCDSRIKELKVGQRLFLFLEKKANGNFYPINESTGELFVDKGNFTNIFIAENFSNPTVLKKGISIFLKTYTFCGNFNDRFLQGVYYLSNKSIFEIYKMKENNAFFKFLIDNELNYYKVIYNSNLQLIS